ncbi:response regulator transcription factor [Enterobacter sp. E105B]|uniref:response regulator transcription factor n=1 Tax=Enterobacter sp. E105B TaxID=3047465 RepID=UPI0025A149B4|nr:response regulator transcription factor [Enterobacter sp. E105B]
MRPTILCVEDDPVIAEQIAYSLEAEGFITEIAPDGLTALRKASENEYVLMTLDRQLPDTDGITLLKMLRKRDVKAPAIMISSFGTAEDRVWGLRNGCDDYMTKPFSSEEMVARVEILLKRVNHRIVDKSSIEVGNLTLDVLNRTLKNADKVAELKPVQFKLMRFLMSNSGVLLTREVIFEAVWGYDFDPGTKLIDVHLSGLRKIIESIDGTIRITAERGAGFVLQPA